MKLAAIYNVWDDWDMLDHSIRNMMPLVDGFIIVGSEKSNYGEYSPIPDRYKDRMSWDSISIRMACDFNYVVAIREPQCRQASDSETDKRNFGLSIAKKQGYTHFIMMDADEFYNPFEFEMQKKRFETEDIDGLVCESQVYFKSPKLTIGKDTTLVPFIHKITPTLSFGWNQNYPFAWVDKKIRIDPTRQMNITTGVAWAPITMHHYSYVRKDLEKKIRNSSARFNLERSTIRQDFALAKEGYFVKFYGEELIRASVDFKIPEYGVEDSQSMETGNNQEQSLV